MREIKFRCWDKTLKAFVNAPFKSMDGVLYAPTGGGRGDCILMQFTGYLDKNGKEIYEGDYLRWLDKDGCIFFEGLVVHYQCGLIWEATDEGRRDLELSPVKIDLRAKMTEHIEVIGNIHENPDLLTNP